MRNFNSIFETSDDSFHEYGNDGLCPINPIVSWRDFWNGVIIIRNYSFLSKVLHLKETEKLEKERVEFMNLYFIFLCNCNSLSMLFI